MKNILLLIFSLWMMTPSHAQSVIATAGGSGAVGNIRLDYTMGESFTVSIKNDSLLATQGFHQPFLTITTIEETSLPGTILVFPNPSSSMLNVKFDDARFEFFTLTLYDISGRRILTAKPMDALWQIDLSHLPNGPYLLRATDKVGHVTSAFKILKSN